MIKTLKELFSSMTVATNSPSNEVKSFYVKNRFIKRRGMCFWCGEQNILDGCAITNYLRTLGAPHTVILCQHCRKMIFIALHKNGIITGRSKNHLRRRRMLLESRAIHEVNAAEQFIAWIVQRKAEVKLPLEKTFSDTSECPICGKLLVYHVVPINSEGTKIITMGGCQSKGCFSWRE